MDNQSKLAKIKLVIGGVDESMLDDILTLVQEQMKKARDSMPIKVQKLLQAFDTLSDEEKDMVRVVLKPMSYDHEVKTKDIERRVSSGEPDKVIDPYADKKDCGCGDPCSCG